MNKEDQKQLKFLYQYSDIIFEDNPENQAKFSALMLVCAYLMDNKDEISRRLQEVQEFKSQQPIADSQFSILNSQFSTELDCYLTIAQFIVTHNPEYRKAAKAWRNNHPDCSLAIRRFLSIAKQIRC